MAKQKYKPKIEVKKKKGDEGVVDVEALDAMVDEEFFKPTTELEEIAKIITERDAAVEQKFAAPPIDVEFAASLTKTGSLWRLILITLKDNTIVRTEVSEGDIKAIVLQKALHALHNFTEPM